MDEERVLSHLSTIEQQLVSSQSEVKDIIQSGESREKFVVAVAYAAQILGIRFGTLNTMRGEGEPSDTVSIQLRTVGETLRVLATLVEQGIKSLRMSEKNRLHHTAMAALTDICTFKVVGLDLKVGGPHRTPTDDEVVLWGQGSSAAFH